MPKRACAFQHADFVEQGGGIDDDTVADDALAAGAQDAAGNKVEDEFFAVDDDGMAGVMAAGVAGHDMVALGEDVDDFAFAFVAPLGAEDDGGLLSGHVRGLRESDAGVQTGQTPSTSLLYIDRLRCLRG